jgi:uncharacterized repeat protein (TIGR01451 family)
MREIMEIKKILVTMLLCGLLAVCTAGSAFAGANIAVSFDKTMANVGDQVILTVTITNTGPGDLSNVNVSAPLPAGLKFMSSATGTTKNQYDSGTGLWQVDNLKMSSQGGGKKTLTVTAEVLQEASGKTITANAAYLSVTNSSGFLPLKSAQAQIKINASSTGTGTGGTNGTTGTTDTSSGIVSTSSSAPTNNNASKTSQIISKLKENNSGNNPLNLPQQALPKAYDVYNSTDNSNTNVPMSTYAIVALVGIGVLVVVGYFVGMRK